MVFKTILMLEFKVHFFVNELSIIDSVDTQKGARLDVTQCPERSPQCACY